MKNSDEDVVDRALLANTVVNYFKRRRPKEILELIAKMLSFNEEQMVDVGLKMPQTNFIASFFNTLNPTDENNTKATGQLAEIWLDYLLNETEENATTAITAADNETKLTLDDFPGGI